MIDSDPAPQAGQTEGREQSSSFSWQTGINLGYAQTADGTALYLEGEMDEVRIWHKALSEESDGDRRHDQRLPG